MKPHSAETSVSYEDIVAGRTGKTFLNAKNESEQIDEKLCHINSLFSLLWYQSQMKTSIYPRHRFHPDIIRKTIWLCFCLNLSFRDIEDMVAERGVDVPYETIRRWIDKFGLAYAKKIKRRADKPSTLWHLDEVYVRIDGKLAYLWRAVDNEGTVLDVVVQTRRNRKAALRLIRKLLKTKVSVSARIIDLNARMFR